jgi:protochlorophyllide reductase
MIRLLSLALAALTASAFTPSALFQSRTTTTTSSSVASKAALSFRSSSLNALATTELPEKLYIPKDKEMPKVLGGVKIGLRKLCVITGASSGLGLYTALTLAKTGRYFIVMACRDVEKAKRGMFTCNTEIQCGLLIPLILSTPDNISQRNSHFDIIFFVFRLFL